MTAPLKTILVAVDFGEASAHALRLAGALAAASGARLRVLHAETLDAPPYFTQAQLDVMESDARANRMRATEFLRQFTVTHIGGPFEATVESRVATDAILHASADADLVVMGTHGRRGPSRWWLGSVAERVLRETAVPLLVVHAGRVPLGAPAVFATGMIFRPGGASAVRTRLLADAMVGYFKGAVVETQADDPRLAREEVGATWVAVPVPTPRSGHWLTRVGEPLVKSCGLPVLFVPEANGGPAV